MPDVCDPLFRMECNNAREARYIYYQRQITLRIVGYRFSSQLTAPLNLCPIYLKLLVLVP